MVNEFNGANDAIGTLVLKFDTKEKMKFGKYESYQDSFIKWMKNRCGCSKRKIDNDSMVQSPSGLSSDSNKMEASGPDSTLITVVYIVVNEAYHIFYYYSYFYLVVAINVLYHE